MERLDLDPVLSRIMQTGASLVGAEFAMIIVLDPHSGAIDTTVAWGSPPMWWSAEALRSGQDFAGSARGAAVHRAIVDDGENLVGRFAVVDSRRAAFSSEDQNTVSALATAAGIAIVSARRLAESREWQRWLAASTEVTRRVLTRTVDDALELIAQTFAALAPADVVSVVLAKDSHSLRVEVAVGPGSGTLVGMTLPTDASLCGRVMATGQAEHIADATRGTTLYPRARGQYGPVLACPLHGQHGIRGVLTAARASGQPDFTSLGAQMAAVFASHAAMALELADAERERRSLLVMEDRDRIGQDLHDLVIQRLFGMGLRFQSRALQAPNPELDTWLGEQAEDLDRVIQQIRSTIYQLRGSDLGAAAELRDAVQRVVDDMSEPLGFHPDLAFFGPVEHAIQAGAVVDVVATVRESLTNVLRHASATHAWVVLTAEHGEFSVEIADDGIGVRTPTRRSGLRNLASRAERLGGRFEVLPRSPGTLARLTVGQHTSGVGGRAEDA